MDTITHGILGALIGKGYFSERHGRVATFAATLGAVFPDCDVAAEIVSRDPLAIVKYHRAITHSFVGLPFFAMLLAWLTRWIARRLNLESPSWRVLTLIYGVAITSHILLDGMTAFGTRMWFPISGERVAWDLLFIIDFTFTAIILLPQVIAWIYSSAEAALARDRAIRMTLLFACAAFAVWFIGRATGYTFQLSVAGIAGLVMAALFFAPAVRGWGFRVTRAAWSQAGFCAMLLYLFACAWMHHRAILQVKAFAGENHIAIERMGALPVAPSFLDWGGAIRSPEGVYKAQFDMRDPMPPTFYFSPDSPPDAFIAKALLLPDVRVYWGFARFPSIRSFVDGSHQIVEMGENRFSGRQSRGTQPFTYRVVFDDEGNVIAEGFARNGMLQRSMMETETVRPSRDSVPVKPSP